VGNNCFLHLINARHLSDFISKQARLRAKARGKGSIKNRPVLSALEPEATDVLKMLVGTASRKRVTLLGLGRQIGGEVCRAGASRLTPDRPSQCVPHTARKQRLVRVGGTASRPVLALALGLRGS
jgi:hypothetical protein